jgi:hypothetical protein
VSTIAIVIALAGITIKDDIDWYNLGFIVVLCG